MKVAVYWNLHKECYSIQSRERPTYGRVIEYADELKLTSVLPTVREKGRQRYLESGRKNVHAFLVGDYIPGLLYASPPPGGSTHHGRIYYHPHERCGFIDENGEDVVFADLVRCTKNAQGRPVLHAVGIQI